MEVFTIIFVVLVVVPRRMTPEMMSVTENKNATNWNLENGYDDSGPVDPQTYPFRVVSIASTLFQFEWLMAEIYNVQMSILELASPQSIPPGEIF